MMSIRRGTATKIIPIKNEDKLCDKIFRGPGAVRLHVNRDFTEFNGLIVGIV
jgi:hypothetical protein